MSYELALRKAGAEIEESKTFGSYWGDLYIRVKRPDGKRGWIHIYYGSCSGCDAFEAEFDYSHESGDDYHSRLDEPVKGCERCDELQVRLKKFGEAYLEELMTQEEAEKKAAENLEWDEEAKEMVKFLKEHSLNSPPPAKFHGVW